MAESNKMTDPDKMAKPGKIKLESMDTAADKLQQILYHEESEIVSKAVQGEA